MAREVITESDTPFVTEEYIVYTAHRHRIRVSIISNDVMLFLPDLYIAFRTTRHHVHWQDVIVACHTLLDGKDSLTNNVDPPYYVSSMFVMMFLIFRKRQISPESESSRIDTLNMCHQIIHLKHSASDVAEWILNLETDIIQQDPKIIWLKNHSGMQDLPYLSDWLSSLWCAGACESKLLSVTERNTLYFINYAQEVLIAKAYDCREENLKEREINAQRLVEEEEKEKERERKKREKRKEAKQRHRRNKMMKDKHKDTHVAPTVLEIHSNPTTNSNPDTNAKDGMPDKIIKVDAVDITNKTQTLYHKPESISSHQKEEITILVIEDIDEEDIDLDENINVGNARDYEFQYRFVHTDDCMQYPSSWIIEDNEPKIVLHCSCGVYTPPPDFMYYNQNTLL